MGFRENLKAELSFANMRVKELATLSGVKKGTIDSYLKENSYTPSVDAAVSIARALGVSVEYLVTGSEIQTGRKKALSSLSPDMRSLILAVEALTEWDRKTLLRNWLQLAEALKGRPEKRK
ncbi:MAG: helix-turn-helix transcriptional regulator [Treponema sp.]|nr:helix-turn-helix transcriptional regulator [Treponema sp.]